MIGQYPGADQQFEAWGARLTRLSLAQVRLRYVIEGRPLDEMTEAALETDYRAGAGRSFSREAPPLRKPVEAAAAKAAL
jgi:hypothetical protein